MLSREEDGSLEVGPRVGFGGLQPTLFLSYSAEPRRGKSRLHIDVNPTDRDQDAELERLLQLGARPADIGQTGQEQWRVLPAQRPPQTALTNIGHAAMSIPADCGHSGYLGSMNAFER
ncbi:lactoylglutathione lyase family protein [Mycobacteroides abscessus subsp. abscessus]|nr:lactoylglutathione lyase family protein [Mycobacteroides abscessus subsp. abscessus]